jgi:hypothetical protein
MRIIISCSYFKEALKLHLSQWGAIAKGVITCDSWHKITSPMMYLKKVYRCSDCYFYPEAKSIALTCLRILNERN